MKRFSIKSLLAVVVLVSLVLAIINYQGNRQSRIVSLLESQFGDRIEIFYDYNYATDDVDRFAEASASEEASFGSKANRAEVAFTTAVDLLKLQSLDLEFLALWDSQTDDLSPLLEMKKLKVLVLYQGAAWDLSPLSNHPSLKELLIIAPVDGNADSGVTLTEAWLLLEKRPDLKIVRQDGDRLFRFRPRPHKTNKED